MESDKDVVEMSSLKRYLIQYTNKLLIAAECGYGLFVRLGIRILLLHGRLSRVSEPACFGAAPGIFFPEPAPAQAPGT